MRALVIAVLCACGGSSAKPAPQKPAPTPAAVAKPDADKPVELTGAVKTIKIEGADALRAEVETMFASVSGKPLDRDQLRAALTAVMKLGGVADVTAQGVQLADGIELVVQVTMHPVLRKLTAIETGGKIIPLGMSAMPTNSALDPHRVQTLAASLRDRYLGTGYYQAAVAWRQTPVANGVEVVIEVTPGDASTIGSIAFTGNSIASNLLSAQVAKWLVAGQPLLADKIESAAQAISAYYWDLGFANVKVTAPSPAAGKNALVFTIEEGPKFRIGVVKLTGDVPDADRAKYLELFRVKRGDVFNRTAIADGRKRVVDAIVATGRPNADVLPLTKVDLPGKTIALTLEVARGPAN